MKILKIFLVFISVLLVGNLSSQWTETTPDTLIVNDSLVFGFEKLTQNQIDSLKLYLVDENGNEVYQAMKTEEGFIFNYLPSSIEYYFKMDNLYQLFTMQELKFLIVLGVIMYGLCQYNKTELAWIFLIFPIIYILIQNGLLYIHVSSAVQNAPKELSNVSQNYGLSGMNMPLLQTQQSSQINQAMNQQIPVAPVQKKEPVKMDQDFSLPKISGSSQSLGGGLEGFNL